MKPETFVCIVPSPLIPLGSKAEWNNELQRYSLFSPDGKLLYMNGAPVSVIRLSKEQVEQNPECWKRVEEDELYKATGKTQTLKKVANEFCDQLAEQKRQESITKKGVINHPEGVGAKMTLVDDIPTSIVWESSMRLVEGRILFQEGEWFTVIKYPVKK